MPPLKFGDLEGKAKAIEDAKEKAKFERQVENTIMSMAGWERVPSPGWRLSDYPLWVQPKGIAVLREAATRIQARLGGGS